MNHPFDRLTDIREAVRQPELVELADRKCPQREAGVHLGESRVLFENGHLQVPAT
jgi:hypothetical protein